VVAPVAVWPAGAGDEAPLVPADVPPAEEAPPPGPDVDEPVPEVVLPDDARLEGAPLLEAAPGDDG
jgi:hypothetical protein